jgi:hypothetical protein
MIPCGRAGSSACHAPENDFFRSLIKASRPVWRGVINPRYLDRALGNGVDSDIGQRREHSSRRPRNRMLARPRYGWSPKWQLAAPRLDRQALSARRFAPGLPRHLGLQESVKALAHLLVRQRFASSSKKRVTTSWTNSPGSLPCSRAECASFASSSGGKFGLSFCLELSRKTEA